MREKYANRECDIDETGVKRVRKIKLAIVGPSDSVSLIEEVGQEFVDRIQLISCIYNDASEVPKQSHDMMRM